MSWASHILHTESAKKERAVEKKGSEVEAFMQRETNLRALHGGA